MTKRILVKATSVLLVLTMVMSIFMVFPTMAASSSTTGYVLSQNMDTLPSISTTAGTTSHGVWSSEYSSSMATNHVTFSQNTSSSGVTSMKLNIADGRYTVGVYCGFAGASSSSNLTFDVWVPDGSTVSRINTVKIGNTVVLGETALTANAWNTIETSTFGNVTSGAIYIEFYSNSASSGQSLYIDNFQISSGAASPTATPTSAPSAPEYIIDQQFENGISTSATPKTTTNGVWSSEYSSSLGVNHVTFTQSSSGYNGTKALKATVGEGRYTIDFYLGFQNAGTDSTLTFKTFVPSGSTIGSIKKIAVNGAEIMGETAITQGQWIEIDAGELGDTDGYIHIEYYSSVACSGQYFYIDDVKVAASDTDAQDSGDDSTETTSGYVNVGYLPYYRTDCYEDLDYDALTHLCLAFFNPDTSSLEITHEFESDSEIEDIIDLAHENGVNVMASYGGSSGKTIYTEILPSSSRRSQLVENMIDHALEFDLDGIDIDIEASESYTEIWDYYSSFISELRERCDEEDLILTTAVAEWYGDAISSSTLNKFDLVMVMAYDDSGANHSTYDMAVEMCDYFADRGVPESKLVMGVPFYGYIANSDMEGSETYKNILEEDPTAYNKDLSNGIAYNGIPTIQRKCEYVMDEGLAGIMIWELGQDTDIEQYSLLRAIKLELYGSNGAR